MEVVDYAGSITNAHLLVDCAANQVLVDVVLQSDGRDVVEVVQSLLNHRWFFRLVILQVFCSQILLLLHKYFTEERT